MPIYEYYCPDNNTVYQFFAKTLAQGQTVPTCPANPSFRMEKVLSRFAITKGQKSGEQDAPVSAEGLAADPSADGDDPRMEAALSAMEGEFASVDENDPRAMGRMMRRMAELTGERIDGEMEEVVRKLEEGTDPEKLEEQLGAGETGAGAEGGDDYPGASGSGPEKAPQEGKFKYKARKAAPFRDPTLYDY
jgi:hypothetical protein